MLLIQIQQSSFHHISSLVTYDLLKERSYLDVKLHISSFADNPAFEGNSLHDIRDAVPFGLPGEEIDQGPY